MKFIKVSSTKYQPVAMSQRERKYYDEYRNCIFVLRTKPHEKLDSSLVEFLSEASTVRRSDYSEYVYCTKQDFCKYMNVKLPVMCNIILIRKSLITANLSELPFSGISLRKVLANVLSKKGSRK